MCSSSRGSGLRNNFHLRGINLLVNDMPYRNADGFTDFESLELATTEDIQVYKGANALRYGGSTLGGAVNPSYTRTSLDGFRAHSGQLRDRFNAHVGAVVTDAIDLRAFYLFAHVDEDLPGNLTAAEFAADRTQATGENTTNDWGRDYTLHHVGTQMRVQLSEGRRLDVAPYAQLRDIVHPIFQVIEQERRDFGVDMSRRCRWPPQRVRGGPEPDGCEVLRIGERG